MTLANNKILTKYTTGATESTHENIGWDDDSDDEDQASTPQQSSQPAPTASENPEETSKPPSSTTNPNPEEPQEPASLKPAESRRSQDAQSQPDSDTSYDLVSGATSMAPGSPKKDDDEEEDWE